MKHPPRLYKYQPFDEHSRENLKKHQIWFSKPIELNDPYDCDIRLRILRSSDEEYSRFYRLVRITANDARYFDKGRPNERLKKVVNRVAPEMLDTIKQRVLSDRGIACFSEENDNLLLWSHYAQKHSGFCLEFNTSFGPFSTGLLREVKYEQDIPSVNLTDIVDRDRKYSTFDKMFTTKAICWSYEREWRIIDWEPGGKPYESECLTAVYFGLKMQENHKFCIMDILKDSPTTKFFDMLRSDSTFQLISRQIYLAR